MANLPKRIALVYDRVNKWGGAERVLLCLHELFPEAPLYTAVYDDKKASWARVFPEVIPSFLQKFPHAKSHHELYPWLTPMAFESFNFDDFDMVISVTSADAKGIITKPGTFHVCYCLTPTRYLWSHEGEYRRQINSLTSFVSDPVIKYLKYWDQIAAQKPDGYIAISQTVKDRIQKYYHQDSSVVYPPVDVEKFALKFDTEDYFLWVGRLVSYKRIQTLVEIFNELKLPLIIIGSGKLENWIRRYAQSNIKLLGFLEDEQLASYYSRARALLFWHEEDFGIVPVEAMASGTAVIGLNHGGVSETVVHKLTGLLVSGDSHEELKNVILNFDPKNFPKEVVQNHAQQFSKERFKKQFLQELKKQWTKYRTTHMF
jgi:glycosyltransferase involved in cell wall biosynthesis